MDLHEELYYNYQTKARNILEVGELKDNFIKRIEYYENILGSFLPKNKDAKIIDVPCGFGNFIYYLKTKGYKNVSGYDFDKNQIDLALKLNLPVVQADAFSILSQMHSIIDVIISIDFLEHLSKDNACVFLQRCYNGLKPGGTIIIRVPNADSPFGSGHAWNDITHKWYITPTAGRVLVEMIGFVDIMFLEDRIPPKSRNGKKKYVKANKLINKLITDMGIAPPRIWSRSMWIIGYKK